MANTRSKNAQITYGRLNNALAKLGFVRRSTDAFTAYREATHDAWIVLPNMSSDTAVGDPHLVTVRNTVVGRGVASADRLQTLLAKSHSRPYAIRGRGSRKGKTFAVKPRKPRQTLA